MSSRFGMRPKRLDDGALQALKSYDWHVVPVPVVGLERLERPVIQPLGAHAEPRRHYTQEMLHQLGDIGDPLPQWRDLDDVHIEPVVEVVPEALLDYFPFEVPVGRGHYPRGDRYRAIATQPGDFAVLQHAQQLGLGRRRELADLIQEDGAGAGR